MTRIDAHQHFWRFDPEAYGWIDESMQVLRRDYLPEHLLPELERHSFDGSIAVQARETLEETAFLLGLADEFPGLLAVVGWVDLCSPAVEGELERLAAHPKLRGLRHIAQKEADDFLCRPDFQRGIAALERFDLAYDVLVYPRQLEAALELAERFPHQRFVLDHLAKPAIARGELEPWRSRIRLLSRQPNVCCKLSGLVTEADHERWKPGDFRPYLDIVFECFGVERLLYGSDWPVCLLAAPYARVHALIEEYTAGFGPRERAAIFGENAARCYGLPARGRN
jgi:L-fuconolactonase